MFELLFAAIFMWLIELVAADSLRGNCTIPSISTKSTSPSKVMSTESEASLAIGLFALFIALCCCLGCGRRAKGHPNDY